MKIHNIFQHVELDVLQYKMLPIFKKSKQRDVYYIGLFHRSVKHVYVKYVTWSLNVFRKC